MDDRSGVAPRILLQKEKIHFSFTSISSRYYGAKKNEMFKYLINRGQSEALLAHQSGPAVLGETEICLHTNGTVL